MKPLYLKKRPKEGATSILNASHAREPANLDIHRRDIAWEWEGGEIVLLACAVAGDRYGDCWWHDMNWAYWSEAHQQNLRDAERLDPYWGWEPLPVRQLTPEQIAASEDELLAFERELYGPFWYVERNSDPRSPVKGSQWLSQGKNEKAKAKPKGGRKSRKKPVYWSPKKTD